MDVDAERERISREIQQLERILDPCCSSVSMDVSESSLNSDSDADSLPDEDLDSDAAGPLLSVTCGLRWSCSLKWTHHPSSGSGEGVLGTHLGSSALLKSHGCCQSREKGCHQKYTRP